MRDTKRYIQSFTDENASVAFLIALLAFTFHNQSKTSKKMTNS